MVAKTKSVKPERGPGRIRGLTRAQYLALSRLVRSGQATWEELEEKGIALPAARESEFVRTVRNRLAKVARGIST